MAHAIFDKDEWFIIANEIALTPRQSEIAYLLFLGKSDKQISQIVGISIPTVRTHFTRLFNKLDVQDRTGLILRIFHHFRYDCALNKCYRTFKNN